MFRRVAVLLTWPRFVQSSQQNGKQHDGNADKAAGYREHE